MLTTRVVFGILLFLLPRITDTRDPDCCNENINCKNTECSCCSIERFNKCIAKGKTNCEGDCKPGYHGGFCYNKCPDHCQTCKDWVESYSRECLTCKQGYHVAYRRCVPDACPDTCLVCENATHCSDCALGHYNGKETTTLDYHADCRLKCPLRCTSCTSQTNCLSCKNGYYGAQCSKVCSNGCYLGICNKNYGSCSCKQNYSGIYCETFKGKQQCSIHCFNYACNTTTGKCLNGCLNNFQEPYCTFCLPNFSGKTCESCASGFYGTNCSKKCPDKCVTCDKETGHCEVCWGNLKGNTCSVCKPGYYGENCNYLCSSYCDDRLCLRVNGACSKGCIPPFSGDRCCLNQSNCKTCVSNSECSACIDGWYGEMCQKECSSKCKICNKENGKCLNCTGNYLGDYCRECKFGSYGHNCVEECSNGCINNTCDFSNGTCQCKNDYYGPFCKKRCSTHCANDKTSRKCDNGNENCSFGCLPDHGGSCEDDWNENCSNNSCHQISGSCCHGCEKGFEGATCRLQASSAGHETVFPVGVSIGVSVGGMTSVIVIIVLMIVIVRRLKHKNANGEDSPLRRMHVYASTSSSGSPSVLKTGKDKANIYVNEVVDRISKHNYDNFANDARAMAHIEDRSNKPMKFHWNEDFKHFTTVTRISLADLADYVLQKNINFFQKEFKEFPNGLQKSCEVSQVPENTPRNRYKGVYPYDEFRVKLQGRQYGDYINASYVDGYKTERAYIACLGPMKKHSEDFKIFWLMVWQQKVEIIVMVTNLFEEEGKVKCEQYWPDSCTSESYGNIVVACHTEDEYADFTIRSFTVSNGKENRCLYQIHFTAWPDKSVPHDVTSLIEFRNRVNSNSFRLNMGGPIIVHCSAGVGRTGTYIALDILTQQGKAEGEVDIFRCVMNLRGQRVNMVQTWDQYRYLHYAVLHSLTFDPEAIPAEHFQTHMQLMTDLTLAEKFRMFQSIPADLSEDDLDAIRQNERQITRNRMNADIEGDSNRPRLYLGMKYSDNDYINAVYLNSYKQKKRYIITQTPMTETMIHFLTLLVQEKCPCIVSLDDPDLQDKSVGFYIPAENQRLAEGKFVISCSRLETTKNYILRNVIISARNVPNVQEHKVLHFQFTGWKHEIPIPETPESFVTLVRAVEQRVGSRGGTAPIIVHCMNAAERSGLFCAVSVLIQKVEVDHEVSVVNTLAHVRSRRSKAIPNKEQFKFCYQCVNAFLQSFDTYSNFA